MLLKLVFAKLRFYKVVVIFIIIILAIVFSLCFFGVKLLLNTVDQFNYKTFNASSTLGTINQPLNKFKYVNWQQNQVEYLQKDYKVKNIFELKQISNPIKNLQQLVIEVVPDNFFDIYKDKSIRTKDKEIILSTKDAFDNFFENGGKLEGEPSPRDVETYIKPMLGKKYVKKVQGLNIDATIVGFHSQYSMIKASQYPEINSSIRYEIEFDGDVEYDRFMSDYQYSGRSSWLYKSELDSFFQLRRYQNYYIAGFAALVLLFSSIVTYWLYQLDKKTLGIYKYLGISKFNQQKVFYMYVLSVFLLSAILGIGFYFIEDKFIFTELENFISSLILRVSTRL